MARDYSAERVACLIASAATAAEDPRTLGLWSRAAGVSTRTLQYVCSAAQVPPAACRDLARVLRLVVTALEDEEGWDPLAQLNADPRTVRRLIERSGLSEDLPPGDVRAFIARQGFVRRTTILAALHRACSRWCAGAPGLPPDGAGQ